jgi:penicillin-binding protein 1A
MAGKGQSGERREPVFDSAPEPHISTSERKAAPRRKRSKAKAKAKRGPRRSLIGRAIYWSLVLGLWLVIGVVGVLAWTGAHMPPLQSLEIPKLPAARCCC